MAMLVQPELQVKDLPVVRLLTLMAAVVAAAAHPQ
jgi:hypothetical protein